MLIYSLSATEQNGDENGSARSGGLTEAEVVHPTAFFVEKGLRKAYNERTTKLIFIHALSTVGR